MPCRMEKGSTVPLVQNTKQPRGTARNVPLCFSGFMKRANRGFVGYTREKVGKEEERKRNEKGEKRSSCRLL